MDSLIKSMEEMFKKLPALPASGVDVLFKIAPWIALIFGILGILGSLAAFGIFTAYAPLATAVGVNYGLGYVAGVGGAIASVLLLVAFPGLKAGKMGGWKLLFYSEAVSALTSLVGISIGGIIGALIGFYILFQIKPRYKSS